MSLGGSGVSIGGVGSLRVLHIPTYPMFFWGDSLTPKKQPWQVFTDISSVALVEAQETFEANHLMVETLLGDFFEPLEGVVETTGMPVENGGPNGGGFLGSETSQGLVGGG